MWQRRDGTPRRTQASRAAAVQVTTCTLRHLIVAHGSPVPPGSPDGLNTTGNPPAAAATSAASSQT